MRVVRRAREKQIWKRSSLPRGAALTALTALTGAASALFACNDKAPRASAAGSGDEPVRQMVGVDPREFRCDSLVSDEQVGALVGGKARAVESAVPTPLGVAAPCTYLVEQASGPQVGWTFDLDCRDGMLERANALFEQYARTSAEAVERATMAGGAQGEPGEPAPALAREVDVGARGLDHHGQGLLFVDDDAPCYVRVVGPGPQARLALAQHLARALTELSAPMTRRARTVQPTAGRAGSGR